MLLFNVGATDDILREEECRINVFHTAPTRTMLADGLAQYLIWKQWRRWAANDGTEIDQIANVIDMIKHDPTSRRIIVSGWNVGG